MEGDAQWVEFRASGADLVGWIKGDGPLLALVLHGGPGLTDYTAEMAEEILRAGDGLLRVARFQQRGVEPSTPNGPFTIDGAVDDVLTVLDELGERSALLAGHSWGAHLAYQVAALAPHRVAGVLAVDALGAIDDGGASTLRPTLMGRLTAEEHAQLDALEVADLGPVERSSAALALLWRGYFADPASAPPMGAIQMVPTVNEALLADAMARLRSRFLEQRLPALVMPSVHVIGGASPIDPDVNIRSAGLMSGSVVNLLPDVGHFPWLEQPGSVETAMRQLVTLLSRDQPS